MLIASSIAFRGGASNQTILGESPEDMSVVLEQHGFTAEDVRNLWHDIGRLLRCVSRVSSAGSPILQLKRQRWNLIKRPASSSYLYLGGVPPHRDNWKQCADARVDLYNQLRTYGTTGIQPVMEQYYSDLLDDIGYTVKTGAIRSS